MQFKKIEPDLKVTGLQSQCEAVMVSQREPNGPYEIQLLLIPRSGDQELQVVSLTQANALELLEVLALVLETLAAFTQDQ